VTDTQVRVGIVGAGLGGIAVAVKLARAGFRAFTVFEAADGPGGVWWQNTYPGAEVDVDSHAYSYSFLRYDWVRTHATQAELQRYVEDVIDRFELRPHLQFGARVHEVRWCDDTEEHVLTTADGVVHHFDIVVSAVGLFNQPRIPGWATDATFDGPVFHTSDWRHDLDLTGKRVALVGTGSSACQVGPAIAPLVRELLVFQREPGYVLPKKEREFTPAERRRFRRLPILPWWDRVKSFHGYSRNIRALRVDHPENARLTEFAHGYIRHKVDDVAVADALTPSYPYGCKRTVFASDWYPMFNLDHVRLVPHEVVAAEPQALVDATGAHHDVDVVVVATGFRATDYLGTLEVHGRGGRSLHDTWGAEPSAFLGVTVPGFPNFFMLFGPNTNGGWSIIAQLERQAELVVRAARLHRRGRTVVDTRPAVDARYQQWLTSELARKASAVVSGCRNYFRSATGKNVTQWPSAHSTYYVACKVLPLAGWRARRRDRTAPAVVTSPEG